MSRKMLPRKLIIILSLILGWATTITTAAEQQEWLLVDDFESGLEKWSHVDVENETDPHVPDPQIAEIRAEAGTNNQYFIKKPAADGLVGNRKAISFAKLPVNVEPGETYTFYTRINVEYFPNNQSFGLTSVPASKIPVENYNSFEPMIRVTDRNDNTGALQILGGGESRYANIINPATGKSANPLETDEWYELWYVVNNAPYEEGGQRYDIYVRGGEFETQQLAYKDAEFRVKREAPLQFFMSTCNTGPVDNPYGNGGVRYDDIYMTLGLNLSSPIE